MDRLMPPVIGLTGKAGSGKDTFYRLVLAPRGYRRIALADPVRGLALAMALATQMAGRSVPGAYAEFAAMAVAGALLGRVEGTGGVVLDRSVYYYTWYGEEKPREVRRVLQYLGTEVGRNTVDPGLWLFAALDEVRRIVERGGRVAITDVRFPDEAAALRGDTALFRKRYEELGKSAHPLVREALTRTWRGGGLVVPRGLGAVIRIRRRGEGLEGELAAHASEVGVDGVAADHTVEAESLLELKARGDALFGPVEAYLDPEGGRVGPLALEGDQDE